MKFKFELPGGYSYRDLLAMNQLYIRKDKARFFRNSALRVMMLLLGGYFILSGLSWRGSGTLDQVGTPLFIGLLWIALAIFQHRLSAWSSYRCVRKNLTFVRVLLTEKNVTTETAKGSKRQNYAAFEGAYEFRDHWFLFQDKRHVEILPRYAMTEGDASEFSAFLEQRTGRAVRKIK